MTSDLFEKWVRENFEPDVKKYLSSKGLPLQAVLLVDNASSHVLKSLTIGSVTIQFLPPNVTSVIQPMDQGAIALLKRRFRKDLLERLILKDDLVTALKGIDVLVALKMAASAWCTIRPTTLAKCWKPIGK